MNTQLSPAEHADRLNKCLEAGLTVVFENPDDEFAGEWWDWNDVDHWRDGGYVEYVHVEDVSCGNRFLVLSGGETIDNFTLPEGY